MNLLKSLAGTCISLKSNSLLNSLLTFIILAGWWYADVNSDQAPL